MFKNSHLRLLMTLSNFKLLGPASEETPESPWMISSDVTADDLKDSLHYINQAEFSPPTFEEGVLAENQLKRKTAPRKKAVFDDDEEGEPDDFLFPAGGPTARKVIDEEKRPKKTRKRRRRGSDAEEKARKRREKDAKKNAGIKSALLVREGDDEFDSDEDRVFYAKEREIREKAAAAANAAHGIPKAVPAPKKRVPVVDVSSDDNDDSPNNEDSDDNEDSPDDDDSDDDDDDDDVDDAQGFVRMVMGSQATVGQAEDTPLDGSDGKARKRRRVSVEDSEQEEDVEMGGTSKVPEPAPESGAVDDDEDAAPVARRPRGRGPFIMDSDDDE